MSVVILQNQIESLRWNGQLQLPGSRACVGTSTYIPKDASLELLRPQYEERTAHFFEHLLRKTAARYNIDFASIQGVANLDVMIPGALETRLQALRKQPAVQYLAECNPRWTNYTDAIMAVLGAQRKEPTIFNMRTIIQEGICTFDKRQLPEGMDASIVREVLFERDAVLQKQGTRIICRMTKNPMGLIFAGNLELAQQEFETVIAQLSIRKSAKQPV